MNNPDEPLKPFENEMANHLSSLIRVILFLVVVQYIADLVFHFQGKTNTANARIGDLTSLVFALVFYLSFSNFSSRIESISFRSDNNDQ